MITVKQLLFLVSLLHSITGFGMNVLRPYQIVLRPPKVADSWMQAYAIGLFGFGDRAFNEDDQVNVLQIYQCKQNALTMLDGFDPMNNIGQLRVRIDASDDGIRGHFKPCGNFYVDAAMHFGLRFFMKHHLSLAFYQPFYKMQLKDVVWENLTGTASIQDARVRSYLTDCFGENVCELGSLDLGGWERVGIGDTTVSLEWIHDYPQQKPLLQNVTINGRLGVTLPSGLKADENKLLAMSYGNNGAIGLIFALGLDLYAGAYVRAGMDVQLMHKFGHARCQRIKTDVRQTDLLLLAKANAFRDFGLTQQFSFYWEFYRILYGASCRVAYQFYKQGDDMLYLTSNEFSTTIANSAESLKSFTTNDAYFILNYDCSEHMPTDSRVSPYLAAFVDIPFNGKRSVVVKNAGFIIALNF